MVNRKAFAIQKRQWT